MLPAEVAEHTRSTARWSHAAQYHAGKHNDDLRRDGPVRLPPPGLWQSRTGVRVRRTGAGIAEATPGHHATAVPSNSIIWPGIASRTTPSIVVDGMAPAAPSREASTPQC